MYLFWAYFVGNFNLIEYLLKLNDAIRIVIIEIKGLTNTCGILMKLGLYKEEIIFPLVYIN
jgi:hypothetical protein